MHIHIYKKTSYKISSLIIFRNDIKKSRGIAFSLQGRCLNDQRGILMPPFHHLIYNPAESNNTGVKRKTLNFSSIFSCWYPGSPSGHIWYHDAGGCLIFNHPSQEWYNILYDGKYLIHHLHIFLADPYILWFIAVQRR
ncbi:hypothetical protein HMPREF3039_02633 [Akkermansia sp. KLE1798]|nr:hypothetical protein HMPREF3039_02633 [Akkermansia sp. KLE1798]KZA05336.1 hypothetical protein HMPREF1326_00950 [Akkermansia sp. KLE1605]